MVRATTAQVLAELAVVVRLGGGGCFYPVDQLRDGRFPSGCARAKLARTHTPRRGVTKTEIAKLP